MRNLPAMSVVAVDCIALFREYIVCLSFYRILPFSLLDEK